jgi:hypothetical protein
LTWQTVWADQIIPLFCVQKEHESLYLKSVNH